MLVRRRIRKQLLGQRIAGTTLREQNVVSHVNGSITVAVRATHGAVTYTPDQVEAQVRSKLSEFGHERMPTLRKGLAQGGRTVYVTFTSRILVVEAESRYGGTPIRPLLEGLEQQLSEAEAAVESAIEEVVVMAGSDQPDEVFEFPAVELPELEASEV